MTDQLDEFLAEISLRAFRMAEIRLDESDQAHDAVQDAMMRLVQKYGHRPREEWRPLFYRILNNRIRDFQRRGGLYRRWFLEPRHNEAPDPVETSAGPEADNPDRGPDQEHFWRDLGEALRELPVRQQETVICRLLEGMDVAETALAMGCTQGTVKTQYARGLASLRQRLGEHAL